MKVDLVDFKIQGGFSMLKNLTVCALTVGMFCGLADAGPFRKRTTTTAVVVSQGAPATAQAAAVLISSTGRFRHNGGHGLFEGIGMGSTEAAAVGNCCQPRFGGRPREVGIARMANGLFVAVCRW